MKKANVNTEACKSCGYCIDNCPRKALSIGKSTNAAGYDHIVIDKELCIGCGICYSVCPDYVFVIVEE